MMQIRWGLRCLGLVWLVAAAACTGSTASSVMAPPDQLPDTTIESGPPALTNQPLAHFVISANIPGSTIFCSVDASPMAMCHSPFEVTLADGAHELIAQAISPRGEFDATPAHYSWQIDTVAPMAVITTAPPSLDNTAAPRFEFTAEPGAALSCALDGGAAMPCSSPFVAPPLTDGSHTFAVTASDAAGNVQQVPASYQWTIDTTVADTAIDDGPAGLLGVRQVAFTFSSPNGEPGTSFLCTFDGDGPFGCVSPLALNVLSDGPHSFAVAAVQPNGNVDPTPAMRTWQIDATPPVIQIVSRTPAQPVAASTFEFTVTGAPPELIECGIKVGSLPIDFAPCSSPFTTPALPDGSNAFVVRARDEAGNSAFAAASALVDTAPPELAIEVSVGDVSSDTSPLYVILAADDTALACDLNGAPVGCTNFDFQRLRVSNGANTFTVHATDSVGNVAVASRSFTTDTAVPKLELDLDANIFTRVTTEASVQLAFPTDAGVTTVCSLDGAEFSPCTTPTTVGPLTDGSHVFAVQAADPAGHVAVYSQQFNVDTRPLSIAITGGPDGPTSDARPTFTWTAPGSDDTPFCRYDNNPFVLCDQAMDAFVAVGTHTFQVQVDGAGGPVASRTFTVLPFPLVMSMRDGPSGTITAPSVSFAFESSSPSVVTECRLFPAGPAQGDFAPCTSPFAVELPGPGAYVFEARAQDAAGGRASAYRAVTLSQ